MKKLIFPTFDYKIKQIGDKLLIFDVIRKDYVTLTPEEWVRQHVINVLVKYKKYPKSLIAIEKGLKINSLAKRTDIVVFTNNLKPLLLIECKAPEEKIDETVLRQALIYNSEKKAQFLCLTNGLTIRIFHFQMGELIEFDDFPDWKY